MEIYELGCKRMTNNIDEKPVDDKVVALHGKEWPIKEAADLVLTRRAKFLYQGDEVTNLDMLPECPRD